MNHARINWASSRFTTDQLSTTIGENYPVIAKKYWTTKSIDTNLLHIPTGTSRWRCRCFAEAVLFFPLTLPTLPRDWHNPFPIRNSVVLRA